MYDHEALVATLQLLLGDVPDEQKRSLFYKAFPDSFVMLKGDAGDVQSRLRAAQNRIEVVLSRADGSSGLGHLAVGQLRHEAEAARNHIRIIAGILGVSLNP
jgi:hypothetical protein